MFTKNKADESKTTNKFSSFKSNNDPYSYDIPEDDNKAFGTNNNKDLFTKKETGTLFFSIQPNKGLKGTLNSTIISQSLKKTVN